MKKNYTIDKYTLDDNQMQLLLNDSNNIVIAGAGSGKTLTIIGKINYLIEKKITTPEKILIISFTNASVNDIKSKIQHNVCVFTFHKLAIYILNKLNFKYKICSTSLLTYIIKESLNTCSIEEQKIILKFLKLKISFKNFINSQYYNSFCNLIETFINLWKTNNLNFKNLPIKYYSNLEKKIILYIFKIYKKYIIEKNSTKSLDFDDLILIATKLVKKSFLDFDYIIIDEFQDTSFIRLNLVREIFKFFNPKIIVVGDDWQSIYRFSGCDLKIFMNFSDFFPNVNTIKLINTYRNSQELISLASSFILKNKYQIKKDLHSKKHTSNPLIFVPYKSAVSILKKIIDYLLTISNDIMILSRNNKDIYNYIDNDFLFENNIIIYKQKSIKYYTIHKSKGLESEYVIVLNCNNNFLGLPNKIENNAILNKLYREEEIKYAEERRLFYVAITRCKEKTFLLYEKNNPSIFITEIKRIVKNKLGKIAYFK